jgi:membrane protease subunit HflC
MKRNPLIIAFGILLAIIVCLLLFVFQVRKSEVAVVTTFGRVTSTETEPGPYLRMPWPIQNVYKLDQRTQNFISTDSDDECLTSDNYNLVVMVYAGWRISKPEEFFPKFANGSTTEAVKTLEGLVRSAKAAVIGKHQLSDLVSTDPNRIKFTDIENEILATIQSQVNSKNYGIEMEYLGFRKMGFPESVTQEVFKRMTSERQVLTSRIQNEGDAEATRIRSAADSKSLQMLADADAEATRIRSEGQRQAADSFTIFQQEPEFASFLLNLSALEPALKSRATLIFDQRSQPFNLFQGLSTNLVNPAGK